MFICIIFLCVYYSTTHHLHFLQLSKIVHEIMTNVFKEHMICGRIDSVCSMIDNNKKKCTGFFKKNTKWYKWDHNGIREIDFENDCKINEMQQPQLFLYQKIPNENNNDESITLTVKFELKFDSNVEVADVEEKNSYVDFVYNIHRIYTIT